MKNVVLFFLLAVFVTTATAQTNDSLFANQILEYETILVKDIVQQGKWCYEKSKNNKQQYKQFRSFSGIAYLVAYESKQPKGLYVFTPNGYCYFDLNLDGIIDGKYMDMIDKPAVLSDNIWKNVLLVSKTSKETLHATVSMHQDLSTIDNTERFQFYDLRDSVFTFYSTMRNEGEPEIIPIPKTGAINSRPGIQREILKYLEFESFGNK